MRTQITLAATAALVANVAAYPQLAETLEPMKRQDANAWAAPGAGDARTACPGLNTLANHGYINRNGRGITVQQMQQGFLDAFGFDFAVTQAGGNNAVALQGNGATTFDLDTLNQPHQIEHDGSLSREDKQMAFDQNANNFNFNATIWGMTLDLYGPVTHLDVSSANTARLGRVQQARDQDFPGWFVENQGGSLAEHGFMLTCMNDMSVGTPQAPQARLDWVNYWITNQRLPSELGWVKRAVSNDEFNGVVNAVQNAPTTSPQPRSSTAAPTSTNAPSSASASATSQASATGSSLASSASPTAVSSSGSSASASGSGSAAGSTSEASSAASASASGSSASVTGSGSSAASTSGPSSYSSGASGSSGKLYPTTGGLNSTTPATTSKPSGSGTTTFPSVPKEVTSSATAKATELAGPAPQLPNGYKATLSTAQWKQVKDVVDGYVQYVETIILGLCGAHGVGGMPMPGVSAPSGGSSGSPAQGGAPWYGGMQPAPAPSGGNSGGGSGGSYAGSPAPPANTCACK